MVDFASHRKEIKRVQAELARTDISYHRRHDLKKYLGRLHKELSEAKKWRRNENITRAGERDTRPSGTARSIV